MLLDVATAKALFAVIIISLHGADALTPQLPLHVEDRGDSWLVTGTPYTRPYANFMMSDMFFRKDTAEVIGIGSHGRLPTTADKKAYWLQYMSQAEYDRVFGPPTRFEPNGIHEIYLALGGGLINTPADAASYAAVLLRTRPSSTNLRADDLRAVEIDGVWHVTKTAEGAAHELLRFSRKTGKVLSGDL